MAIRPGDFEPQLNPGRYRSLVSVPTLTPSPFLPVASAILQTPNQPQRVPVAERRVYRVANVAGRIDNITPAPNQQPRAPLYYVPAPRFNYRSLTE